MKVAIVGYGLEGADSASYWHQLGHDITVCDQNSDLEVPQNYKRRLGENYLEGLQEFDIIVRSAGVNPKVILDKNPDIAGKITTHTEEFMRVCSSRNIIGVTGTKGKGTTSTLISKMLESSGYTTHLGGNIGSPILNMLSIIKPDEWVVLELSSFQLVDFKGPGPKLAVCLMVVPEHLNWHANMDEYLDAKSKLFSTQSTEGIAVFFAENKFSKEIADKSPGKKLPYFTAPGATANDGFIEIDGQKICALKDVKLLGKHNWQNICAAVTAVWQITQNAEAIASVIKTFSGLEHRLEFVREVDEVKYYDDSYATTPETAIAAIEAFGAPKVLILGGSDKGIPLDPIATKVAESDVRHVIAIGDMTSTIEKLLRDKGFQNITTGLTTMAEIINEAKEKAQPGDVVLLSTGCASFGLFKDYKDRGNQFKNEVNKL